MKRIKALGKLVLIITLVLTQSSCQGEPLPTAQTEPSKESIEILYKASALANSLQYKEARQLMEDKYEIIKDNVSGLNAYSYWEAHIFENYRKAESLINRAIRINPQSSEAYAGMGYIYEAKGKYIKAIEYYEKAAQNVKHYENVPLNPQLAIVYSYIGQCYRKLNNLEEAKKTLEKALENNPYCIEANALLHELYVETGEYEKAYEIWKTDNLVAEGEDHVYKEISERNNLYRAAVEDKDHMDHLQLAGVYEALVLYDEASFEYEKALSQHKSNEEIKNKLKEIKLFLSFRDELKALLDDYYRARCINGDSEELKLYERIKPAYEKIAVLFPHLGEGSVNSVWIDKLNGEIETRFNVRIKIIKANGRMMGLHFGRIADRSEIHSSLWGEEIDLKVTTLKNMTSNGLDSWRTMGSSGVGGWSLSRTEIVRVIMNVNDNLLQSAALYDEAARKDVFTDRVGRETDQEVKEPLALYYSPEVKFQLLVRQIDAEAERARAKGISDNEMQRYLYERIQRNFMIKTNIYVHESQHSIDYARGVKWKGENEYRPKISQLAYGEMPFMSLDQFYDSSIGTEIDDTHSQANTRVFKDIVQYIYDNQDQYPQIDRTKNILSQLTKLSEEELKDLAIEVFQRNYPD